MYNYFSHMNISQLIDANNYLEINSEHELKFKLIHLKSILNLLKWVENASQRM